MTDVKAVEVPRKRRPQNRRPSGPKKVFVLLSDASVKDKIVGITMSSDEAADAMAEGVAVAAKTAMIYTTQRRKPADGAPVKQAAE